MKKIVFIIVGVLAASISQIALAQTNTLSNTNPVKNFMSITHWYGAKNACSYVSGEWKGKAYDTQGLFGDSGPWSVTVRIIDRKGKLFGDIKAPNKIVHSSLQQRFWADCSNGVITNLQINKPSLKCGDVSPPSVLATAKLLLLYVHYENAMIGTNFLLVLNPVKKHLSKAEIKYLTSVPRPNYKTCH